MTQRAGGSITAAPSGDARADDTGTDRERLEPLRRVELLARLSGAFDLAESQQLGHAARVAHIALQLADRIGIEDGERDRLLYVALLHDAGVAVRELPGEVDPVGGHTAAGAWAASLFGLDDEVQSAIRATHERWDGEGRPRGIAMAAIPDASLFGCRSALGLRPDRAGGQPAAGACPCHEQRSAQARPHGGPADRERAHRGTAQRLDLDAALGRSAAGAACGLGDVGGSALATHRRAGGRRGWRPSSMRRLASRAVRDGWRRSRPRSPASSA